MMKVLFTFNPEGAGHASRSIAIANELRGRDAEIWFAGSGKGLEFVKANEFPYFEVPDLKFHKHIMEENYWPVFSKFPYKVLKGIKIYKQIVEDFDLVVSDTNISSMVAPVIAGIPLIYLSHDLPKLHSSGGLMVKTLNSFALHFSTEFIFPNIFLKKGDLPPKVREVGPLAHVKNKKVEKTDVFIVPSQFGSLDFGLLKKELEKNGVKVRTTSDKSWKTAPNLYPFINAASKVICSGYSTLMECSLANTPTIIIPKTPEQKFIGEKLSKIEGFHFARSENEALELIEKDLAPPSHFDNGAEKAAEIIHKHLS